MIKIDYFSIIDVDLSSVLILLDPANYQVQEKQNTEVVNPKKKKYIKKFEKEDILISRYNVWRLTLDNIEKILENIYFSTSGLKFQLASKEASYV